MAAYTFRMPAGIPGEVTRLQLYGATIKAEKQNTTTPVGAYGVLAVIDGNGARPIVAGDTAMPNAQLLGISVRPFPSGDIGVAFPAGIVPFGSGTPPTTGIISILRRGYISVKLNGAAAATKGGAVYVWFAATAAPHVQGGFEAATNASAFLLTNASFEGPADAAGNTEIGFNI